MISKYLPSHDNYMDLYKYPHKFAVRPFRMAANIYYVGNSAVSSHLIDTGEGLILIDTTFPHTYPLLINSIWEAGFSTYDIKYIIHTHGHFDHYGGTSELAALTKAKTVLSAEDARMLREWPELVMADQCLFCYLGLFTPDVEIEDGQIISLGNTEIRSVLTPGHSPGVTSFIIKVTDGNATYTAGMQGGAGLNTMNITFLEKFNLDVSKVRNDFLEGLKKLEKEKVDITLENHPSKNGTFARRKKMLENPDAPNPFIDPAQWLPHLSEMRDKFNVMLEEEAQALAAT